MKKLLISLILACCLVSTAPISSKATAVNAPYYGQIIYVSNGIMVYCYVWDFPGYWRLYNILPMLRY